MPAYDGIFSAGSGVNDVLTVGTGIPSNNAGLWVSRPSGRWSVEGQGVLVGQHAGGSPAFLTRPPAEPSRLAVAYGSSQAMIGVTPPGGWGSSATAFAVALNWSAPGGDVSLATYYLAVARPSTVSAQPSTLTVSKVEAGTLTLLSSVAWPNDPARDYDLIFESWCEYLGRPVYLTAAVIHRAAPPPTLADPINDLAYGGGTSGATVLGIADAAPGLSNGLIGCPALVALLGTESRFSRIQLRNDAPYRAFSGFGPRPIGHYWAARPDGSIAPRLELPRTPPGVVLPL